jgi:short-subunit dehydrogenase
MKYLIFGASTGIGKALAEELYQKGHDITLASRRIHLLENIKQNLEGVPNIISCDISQEEQVKQTISYADKQMSGIDIIVINAGVGMNEQILKEELKVIETNVKGFTLAARKAFDYFSNRNKGHVVGITSVARFRGFYPSFAYSASKAYDHIYLEGLRHQAMRENLNIYISEIMPGFIDTPILKNKEVLFWVASAQKAANLIIRAINRKANKAFIPGKWWLPAFLLNWLPQKFLVKILP